MSGVVSATGLMKESPRFHPCPGFRRSSRCADGALPAAGSVPSQRRSSDGRFGRRQLRASRTTCAPAPARLGRRDRSRAGAGRREFPASGRKRRSHRPRPPSPAVGTSRSWRLEQRARRRSYVLEFCFSPRHLIRDGMPRCHAYGGDRSHFHVAGPPLVRERSCTWSRRRPFEHTRDLERRPGGRSAVGDVRRPKTGAGVLATTIDFDVAHAHISRAARLYRRPDHVRRTCVAAVSIWGRLDAGRVCEALASRCPRERSRISRTGSRTAGGGRARARGQRPGVGGLHLSRSHVVELRAGLSSRT